MKKLLIACMLVLVTIASFAQKTKTHKIQIKKKISTDKYHDNIDNRMKGPKGEVIYIGANGGRYYLKNGKKNYVEYKGNKK
jgi:nitrous oxide reductase accessory protein NosL